MGTQGLAVMQNAIKEVYPVIPLPPIPCQVPACHSFPCPSWNKKHPDPTTCFICPLGTCAAVWTRLARYLGSLPMEWERSKWRAGPTYNASSEAHGPQPGVLPGERIHGTDSDNNNNQYSLSTWVPGTATHCASFNLHSHPLMVVFSLSYEDDKKKGI